MRPPPLVLLESCSKPDSKRTAEEGCCHVQTKISEIDDNMVKSRNVFGTPTRFKLTSESFPMDSSHSAAR